MQKPFECPDCKRYKTCKSLCATAERYVNQDCVNRKSNEILHSVTDYFIDSSLPLDYVYYKQGLSPSDLPSLDKYYSNSASELDLSFLTTREHICIEYFFYEGMSIRDIADILGISRGAVSYYLASAKRKIKTKIGLGIDVSISDQTYTYHNVNRPDSGWEGLLIRNFFVEGMTVEECREEFSKCNYDYLGTSPKAIGRINRIIRYFKNNASLLDKKIEEVKKSC